MQILALVAEYRERVDEQVVVLFQVLAAEINFGYKFQTVRLFPPPVLSNDAHQRVLNVVSRRRMHDHGRRDDSAFPVLTGQWGMIGGGRRPFQSLR